MPLIPEELIDEVQSRADVAEVIGRYVPLRRAGRHFKANCPFHKERTPSFMVNTEKQIFHCFGCGVGGNVFSFLMQHDRLTFPEAVRELAEHVGVRIPEQAAASGDGSSEVLAALMEKICRYFERTLLEPSSGRSARAYLERRGVSAKAREAFRVGLAPAGWDGLLRAATSAGVPVAQLEAAGLIIKGKSGSHYDRFRHRLIFPIMDARSRIVGFGGRSLEGQEPKYLNSPETALYTKGRHLFGLPQAKDAMVRLKTAVVVEGYFDCVVLWDAGVAHAVSPLGTAMTSDQARLLKRYVDDVVLAFDADAAGEQATLRGIDLLVEAGLQVRIASLPEGVDPDECVRSLGRERFERLLAEQSLNLFDFLVQTARRRLPGRLAEDKVRAAQFVLPTIAKVPNAMLRREYVRLLADRLQLDESAVAEELTKVQPRPAVSSGTGLPPPQDRPGAMMRTSGGGSGAERMLTALVLDDPSRWERVEPPLAVDEIADPHLRAILLTACSLGAEGRAVTPAHVVSRLPHAAQGALVAELVELARATASKDAAFDEALRRVRAGVRRRELSNLRDQLREAQASGQEPEVRRLLSAYQTAVHHGV
jgi:DNA primase